MKGYIRFTVGLLSLLGVIGSVENSIPLTILFMAVLFWCVRSGQRERKVQYIRLKGESRDELPESIHKRAI